MSIEQIFNFIRIDANTITAGQPTELELQAVAQEGFKTVLNLAPIDARYSLVDEAHSCVALGMDYIHIPVDWDEPTVGDFEQFKQTMLGLDAEKVFLHCAANYRVTAFYSIYAKQVLGWSDDRAKQLRAKIWKSNPQWFMDDAWSSLLVAIDQA